MGADDGAGGFFAKDFGFGGWVKTCAEVSAMMRDQSVEDWSLSGKRASITCRCS